MAKSNNNPDMEDPICGGIVDFDYTKNSLEINVIAGFAVDEYNKKENKHLELKKVLKPRTQVVAGTMYYIELEVTDGGQNKHYEAQVWQKIGGSKELVKFNPILDAPSDSGA